jgi:HAD superfamily hydrolase (TIGR01509 family)
MAVAPNEPPFHVSHVLLDVGETLVDYGSGLRDGLAAAAACCSAIAGKVVPPEQLQATREAVSAEPAWRSAPVANVRREAARRVLEPYRADTAEHIDEVMEAYEEARDRAMTVYPDVPESLAALSALGITLVAASNGNVDLDRVGLAEHISGTYYAVDAGVTKPDLRFFTGALAQFGIEPSAAVFVGDRLDNDYLPARAAGMHAILLDRHSAAGAETDVTDASVLRITSLAQLPPMVALA